MNSYKLRATVLVGTLLASLSLTASAQQPIGGGIIVPGRASGTVTAPSLAPTVAVESTSTGAMTAGTWYCVYTYVNRNGETTASPQTSIVTTGSTTSIYVRLTDYGWITGAYKFRVYCGNSSGGPYYLQTPKSVSSAVANNGFTRVSNVVTVTTSAAHPFRKYQVVTIAGDTGCGTSVAGSQTITDVLSSTTFTFAQTAGNETCGGASATGSYSPAIDTTDLYVGVLGMADFIVNSVTLSGNQPPSTNTATIDALQVAVNQMRPVASGAFTRGGRVYLNALTYTLTTPLVCYECSIEGHNVSFQEQSAYTGSLITSTWNDNNTGTVMVMGPHSRLTNLGVTASGTNTNAIMIVGGTTNMNGQTWSGVFGAPNAAGEGSGLRVYRTNVAQNWSFFNTTFNGGRRAFYTSNASFNLAWDGGRTNCSGSFTDSSAFVHAAGPVDVQRGAKVASDPIPSAVALKWGGGAAKLHATESCKGIVVDFGGGLLELLDGWQNADGTHPAGTDSIVRLWSDNWSSGSSTTGFRFGYGTIIFGSANVNATVKMGPGATDYGRNYVNVVSGQIGGSTNSGTNTCIDMNSLSVSIEQLNTLITSGCSFDPNVDSSNGAVVNVAAGTPISVINGNGKDTASGVSRGYSEFLDAVRLRQGGDRTRSRWFDIDTASPFNLRFMAANGTTVHGDWDSGGSFRFLGAVGAKGVSTTLPATAAFYSASNGFGFEGRRTDASDCRVIRVDSGNRVAVADSNCVSITTPVQFVSTLPTGTAPFSVASTTNVANLNASSLNGATFAAPGTIGGATPAAATFTTLTANTSIVIAGSGAKTGFSGNSATIGTTSGVLTSGNCAKFDGNGNIVDYGGTCGGTSAATNVVANVTIVTATTTTTGVQTLQTGTIGAGTATVGSQYQFTAKTEYTNGDSAVAKSANHQWGLDGSALGSACQTATIGAGASAQAYLELHITVLSTGAGGTAMIYTRCTPSTTSTDVSNMSATTVAFDTTVAHTISQRVNQTATTDANSTMIGRFLFGMKYN